jgi:prophage tail gpP-like protein
MSTPIPGKNYTVVSGDSLSAISAKAYGSFDHWPTIHRANIRTLKDDDPNLIFPGEVIFIPVLADFRTVPNLSNKGPNDFTLTINGREVTTNSARIIRTMDTAADAWAAPIPWNPGEDPELDAVTKPYTYADSVAYIGGVPLVSGPLYGVTVSLSPEGKAKNLSGNSYTADAIDSTMRPPYEKADVRLEDLAAELVAPLGIKAIFKESSGGKFDRVTAEPTETIFEFLAKLAGQRGLLISSDREGNMVFLKANTSGSPVGTIEEGPDTFGAQGAIQYEAVFDGRKRFSSYKALSQNPAGNKQEALARDNSVNRPRFKTFMADDLIEGELQNAADWQRSKQLADALTIPFPVSSWYNDSGDLWRENTLVTVVSETIFVPNGFDFLIREVEYIYETSGVSAVLKLVPPQVYTGEELVLGWD